MPTQREVDEVVGFIVTPGPAPTKGRQTDIDQTRVELTQGWPIKAELFESLSRLRIKQDVSFDNEIFEQLCAGWWALAQRFALPVRAIGVGEGADDLRPFEARAFARALMGLDD